MVKKAIPAGEHASLLLSAATGLCYRPGCDQQLLVDRDGLRVVAFEIAHIRDELPPANPDGDLGWRYWPDDLTQDERNRFTNLLLLCQACHKLIDRLRPRDYPVSLLLEWKAAAEVSRSGALALGGAQLDLHSLMAAVGSLLLHPGFELPAVSTPDRLSFASRWTDIAGRHTELSAVADFLGTPETVAWWIVVGPAGAGKSRLALEACLESAAEWTVGFVSEANQTQLGNFVPTAPTFLVIDYAASRAAWLGDFLHSVIHRTDPGWPPLRLLVLERDLSEDWFALAVRRKFHHESVKILSAQYAEPLRLEGLSRESLGHLVELAADAGGQHLTSTAIEHIVDRALELDRSGRPLFALIAFLEHAEPRLASGSRDGLLRLLVRRRHAQLEAHAALAPRLFLELVATMLGGFSLAEMLRLRASGGLGASMIPDPSTMTTADLESALPGLVPDILGELWVLDEFEGTTIRAQAAGIARDVAWRHSPQRYAAFVQRTLRDHPGHGAISEHFRVDPSVDEVAWFQMTAGAIPFLGTPRSPMVAEIVQLLDAQPAGALREEAVAEAKFAIANLYLNLGDPSTAMAGYSSVIATAPAGSEVRWKAHTNRGVVLQSRRPDLAEEDWTAVINAPDASDESRACCLNNRADIRVEEGNHPAAVDDRTRVLGLHETSFNRRYIALARRAESYLHLRQFESAILDIEAILATDDIVLEQKMAARLRRVEWIVGGHAANEISDLAPLIRPDLQVIVESRRNFDTVERRARELVRSLNSGEGEPSGSDADPNRPRRQPYFAPVRGPN